jgi:hypothetical protein
LRLDRTGRVRGCFLCLDAQHATSSAFKSIKVEQVAKSRRYSSEPDGLSAAWAKRRLWGAGHHVQAIPQLVSGVTKSRIACSLQHALASWPFAPRYLASNRPKVRAVMVL